VSGVWHWAVADLGITVGHGELPFHSTRGDALKVARDWRDDYRAKLLKGAILVARNWHRRAA